jgi:acyl-CoA oxidase
LAAFQLNQEKLMWLLGWRLYELHDSGRMTTGQASLGKVRSTSTFEHLLDLLFANRITADYLR